VVSSSSTVLDKKEMSLNGLEHTDIQNIKETELLKAKEHAEESDRLKSAFLANMSHEITPMNGTRIRKFIERTRTDGRNAANTSLIESGVRMLNIINDIVDISKIEAGLMEVNVQQVNINKQIEFIYTFFKPQIREKGTAFDSEIFYLKEKLL
jgi:signal transduction histidine kinase